MHSESLRELVQFLQGEPSGARAADLPARLAAEPELAERLLEVALEETALREWARARSGAISLEEAALAGEAAQLIRCPTQKRVTWRAWCVALAVALALGVALIAIAPWTSRAAPVIGKVIDLHGEAVVRNEGGESHPVWPGLEIRRGQSLATAGGQSIATLEYLDGTQLTLIGEASLTCSGEEPKHVVLHQGMLGALVTPQPAGKPMSIATPTASVEVLGTEFSLAASPRQTDVAVHQGQVRLTRAADGESIEVTSGRRAVAAEARSGLATAAIPEVSDTWTVDFERGLPDGWAEGLFTATDTPPGAAGAIRAQPVPQKEGTLYGIKTPKAWTTGLFTLCGGSHLHFTYRLDKPDWFQVFLSTRTGSHVGESLRESQSRLGETRPRAAARPKVATYRFKNELLWWPLKPGQWRTASVPLAAFGRVSDFSEQPPAEGELPFELLFSSKENDLSLVIDRIWVTPDGPGTFQVSP
jgi:ferric-dicitrate binding protein FerR (iron transport regulator)